MENLEAKFTGGPMSWKIDAKKFRTGRVKCGRNVIQSIVFEKKSDKIKRSEHEKTML